MTSVSVRLSKVSAFSLFALVFPVFLFGADVSGNWLFSVPGPDGTSRDTYFRLRQDGTKLTGCVQQGFNMRNIESGTIEGNHLTFSTSFNGRGQTVTVTYEGDLVGDELRLKSSGGFGRGMGRGPAPGAGPAGAVAGRGPGPGRGPTEMTAKRVA